MELREIMTDEVAVVEPDSRVNDAAQVMKRLNVGSVPVCQGREPIGIVTDRDIVLRSVAEGNDSNTAVSEIMSTDLVCGTPEMDSEQAAEIMSSHQIRRLPVVEREELVGMVALGDLAINDKLEMEASEALSYISYPGDEVEADNDLEAKKE